jgi:hypothetical protein
VLGNYTGINLAGGSRPGVGAAAGRRGGHGCAAPQAFFHARHTGNTGEPTTSK